MKNNLIKNKRGTGLRPFTISIILVVLFSFVIFSFAGNFIQAKNPNSEILSSKYGLNQSIDTMNETISDFSDFSTNIRTQLGGANPSAVDYIFLIFQGAFYIPLAFLNFVFSGFTNITYVIFPALAGTGLGSVLSIIIGIILSSTIVTVVLLIVKSIRTGESER